MKNSSKKWFPTQLNSTAKNSRTAVLQRSLALNFKWNALTAGISWQHTHSKLVGSWHHFTFFTGAPFLCTQSVILDFYFILVTSNTVNWASLFGAHRFKQILFSMLYYSLEKFSNFWDGHSCFAFRKKVFGVYIFPYFVLVQYIVVQSLVKTFSRHVYTFCLSLFSGDMQLFELIEKKKLNVLFLTCQSKEKNTN